ncbi:MAG: leucyl/phenylalanyl-tRNA--protein transferase [Paracoccaceae bacterium]
MTLSPELLLHAYSIGVFPMAEYRDDPEIFWVDPKRRGVIPLDGFHISRSLARTLRAQDYVIRINSDFAGVIDGCAERQETWINTEIRDQFLTLHDQGHAHSLEVCTQNGVLIGGVYGLAIGGAFFGESMFSRQRDASKIALSYLVDHLRCAGFTLFDTQFLTDHLASLGGIEISRAKYKTYLADALLENADFSSLNVPNAQDVLQRNAQTS